MRTAFKGQVFTTPMQWDSMLEQLENMHKNETFRSVPITGEALVARVQIAIRSGLIELNRYIKQATIRRPIIERLIKMWHDVGHPDFQQLNWVVVREKIGNLTLTDEPTVPIGIVSIIND